MISRLRATMRKARGIPKYSKQGRVVVNKMTNNNNVPNPPVPLADAEKHLDELDKAEQLAQNGPIGAAADRDSKLVVVMSDMDQLMTYTEAQANANPEKGQAIIEGAGFFCIKRIVPSKPDFAAKHGKGTGEANLVAKAKKGGKTYYWQMSTDQTSWTDLPPTVFASTSVSGLTPATIYHFRFRTLSAEGFSDWSATVSLIAL